METIRNYLENVFKTLPETEEIVRLKSDLFSDMEAKYHELRQSGRSENEAIGKVIGEFGNIEELLDELGIVAAEKDALPVVTIERAREFLTASAKTACLIGIGVFIILVAVSIFIGFSELFANPFPVALLLLMIIPAVALFIYSGTSAEKFKFIEDGSFNLDRSAEIILREEKGELKPRWTISVIAGVSLCIFGAAALIVVSGFGNNFDTMGVSLLLVIVAFAVFIFIRTGGTSDAYKKLLKEGDFDPSEKRANKVIGGVAGLVWPITVCIFLIWGFMFDGWKISWIVFPITGILFGGFASIYSSLSRK